MWLRTVLWYLVYLVKYLLFAFVFGFVAYQFSEIAGIVVLGLFALGAFSAAASDLKEKKKHLEADRLKHDYKKLKHEFDGFDEMVSITRRSF